MKNILPISLLCLAAPLCGSAETSEPDSATIYFRQSVDRIEADYMNNASVLDSLMKEMGDSGKPGRLIVGKFHVKGTASPEGSIGFNRGISDRRARTLRDYVEDKYNLSDSVFEIEFTGRDWKGLKRYVTDDSNTPYREETLRVIENIISRLDEDSDADNINLLKGLHGGVPYRYLYKKAFPILRYSRIEMTFRLPPVNSNFGNPEPSVNLFEENWHVIPEIELLPAATRSEKPFYMALKTNMLYDALALPNIGAEFYLGKNISVVGNWIYGWWDNDNRHRYWRAYGGDLALRWWFGNAAHEKPLTGHHIGIYGGIFTYDFEFGGTGYMGGKPHGTLWDKNNIVAGVEYGYSLPIGRRLNIDFTLGIGYMGGQYYKYIPKNNCYVWQSTHNLRWFGPTKAEISLTWLIGRGNYNK